MMEDIQIDSSMEMQDLEGSAFSDSSKAKYNKKG